MHACVQEAARKQAAKMEAAAAARNKRKAALRDKMAAAKEWSAEEVWRRPATLQTFQKLLTINFLNACRAAESPAWRRRVALYAVQARLKGACGCRCACWTRRS
jgi:hypothetical protein